MVGFFIEHRYDCTDMSIFRSALSCCVVKGLRNVRNYIQRDRQRAENRDRHARHNTHHANPHNLAQQAAAAAMNAQQQPQPPQQLLVAAAAAVNAGAVVAAAGNDNNEQPQPMDQDDINNNNNNNGCPLCRGEGAALAAASGSVPAAQMPVPLQPARSRVGGACRLSKCYQLKRGVQRHDGRERLSRHHHHHYLHTSTPTLNRHQLARGAAFVAGAGAAGAAGSLTSAQTSAVTSSAAGQVPVPVVTSKVEQGGASASSRSRNTCPHLHTSQATHAQQTPDPRDVTDDSRCHGDDVNAASRQ